MHRLTTQDNTHLNQLGNQHSHCFTIIINSQPSMRNKHTHPHLQEASHLLFTHLTQHIYQIKNINYPVTTTVHVNQIAKYILFNEELRCYHNASNFISFPIGYPKSSQTWNDGASLRDNHRFSIIHLAEDTNYNNVIPSEHPITLFNFYITLVLDNVPPINHDQDIITRKYSLMMAAQQKWQREFAEEHHQKRVQAGNIPKNIHSAFKHHNMKCPVRKPCTPSPSLEPQSAVEQNEHQPTISEVTEKPEDTTPHDEEDNAEFHYQETTLMELVN